ncbi:glycerophosphoryl diester phosphodiesterase [Nocardioides flavus (ex Wang et al. 2016)]|uniref:glycerophosphodiester phosphodiesterase n=1 Tax=Nocardioides flavus (ex Wang et al. 2016) TaxID=2058780 RepID=A0ABQ3HK47_9ACTN|nr:glycerophosphodiester phosphodiesterase family protein [Nocardioides flavus (ex Wang et al. 2016)]GHE17047.1 glycerophosphoryl diester phosphodiesterase [Nocardioides flavus (ex Wang et al. 2016)]
MTVTREAVPGVHRRTSSLVLSPAVVAHRGASGHRPEHTLDAYRTAIRMGADDIELDLVSTKDGVLVARHDLELGATTDVARRPDLAHLRRTVVVDGVAQQGWFAQDLTLTELTTLTARERMPATRPASAAYDGAEGVPTLDEVLAMVATESARRGRPVGVMLELKHAAHHDAAGLPLDVPLLRDLARHGLDHPWARVTLMAFEAPVLRRLAARTRLPVVQLLGAGERVSPEDLDRIDDYADGIGAHRSLVLPRDPYGAIGTPSTLVRDAHRRGLTVHVWTVRGENRYLPTNLRRGDAPDALGDMAGEVEALLDAGVDGVITDHPEAALAAVRGGPAVLGR